jgi:hypothetical protein
VDFENILKIRYKILALNIEEQTARQNTQFRCLDIVKIAHHNINNRKKSEKKS